MKATKNGTLFIRSEGEKVSLVSSEGKGLHADGVEIEIERNEDDKDYGIYLVGKSEDDGAYNSTGVRFSVYMEDKAFWAFARILSEMLRAKEGDEQHAAEEKAKKEKEAKRGE